MYCYLDGGFGNHLLLYLTAKLISLKLNKKLKLSTNIINNDNLIQRNDTRTSLIQSNMIKNIEIFNKDEIIFETYELEKVLRQNEIIGYFSYNTIKNNINFIKNNLINLNFNVIKKLELDENHIVISLRLGMGENEVSSNIFSGILQLPIKYYTDILDEYSNYTIYICSDNYTHKNIEILKLKYSNIILLNNYNTLEQYKIILNSKIFISSNSSFSLSSILFMKSNSKIYLPLYKDKIRNNINLEDLNKKQTFENDDRIIYKYT